ncbi:hypothetical protein CcaCcLH18_02851 [Colletotrichum camelliae]|nr:hypothetical protein CcaCcLH18_02851 [Colletotrichum camelliae]
MKSTLAVLFGIIGSSFAVPTEFVLADISKDAKVHRRPTGQRSAHLDAINVQVYLKGAIEECWGRELDEDEDEDEVTGGELDGEELGEVELDEDVVGTGLDKDEVAGGELEGEELGGVELDEEMTRAELEGTGLLDVAELLTENGLEIGAVITGDAGGEEDALEITLPEEEAEGDALGITLPEEEAEGDELAATEELPTPEEATLDEDADVPGVLEVRELDPTDTGLEELVAEELVAEDLLAIDELVVDTGRVLEPELLLPGTLLGAMPPTIARTKSPTNRPVAAGLETGLDGTLVDGTDMTELLDPRLVGDELPDNTELGEELAPDGVIDAAPELGKELTPDGHLMKKRELIQTQQGWTERCFLTGYQASPKH